MELIIKESLKTSIQKTTESGRDQRINEGENHQTDDEKVSTGKNRFGKIVPKMLIVGDAEVAKFDQIRSYMQEELGEEMTTDSYPGRRLGSCIRVIQELMTPETKIVLLWALTPLAWRRVSIEVAGRRFTVFAPNENFSLDEVPQIMEEITTHVKSKNRHCAIFLVLPVVKDMYRFNQKRLVQNLDESYQHFLQDDLDLNPYRMRDFAVRAFNRFMELESDDYLWTEKQILKATYAINRHFQVPSRTRRKRKERGWLPPHLRFIEYRSLSLNLDIMSDGLHGNADFMKSFILGYRRVFQQLLGETTRSTRQQPVQIERVREPPQERISRAVSFHQREENRLEQNPEPEQNNIVIQSSEPWVSTSAVGSNHEDEPGRSNLSVDGQAAQPSFRTPTLLGTRPQHPDSQIATVNNPIPFEELRQSFQQEGTSYLSPVVQRAVEEGADLLVSNAVPRNHTRRDLTNAFRGLRAIVDIKLQQLEDLPNVDPSQ